MTDFQNDEPSEPSDLVKHLRNEIKNRNADLADARRQIDTLKVVERDLAFAKAGIPETGPGALLRKAYDGELSPDAIKAAAETYGINPVQAESGFSVQSADNGDRAREQTQALDDLRRMQATSAGTAPQNLEAQYQAALQAARAKGPQAVMEVVRQFHPDRIASI